MRSAMLLQRLDFESKRQNDVSRSLHSLAAVGRLEQSGLQAERRATNFVPRHSARRQTAEVDFSYLRPKQIVVEDDRPVLRRKRFTRRQRKSATICPETGLILAAGSRASSSDEDDLPKKVSPSPSRLQPTATPRGLSASTFELSLPENREDSIKRQPRGPAARRAGRRNAKLQQQIHASAHNLDRIDETPLKSDKRSLSVRDLQGEECDFTNRDSVTKWTSQILAELESLPSSCIDLHQQSTAPSSTANGHPGQYSQSKWATTTTTIPLPAIQPVPVSRMTQSSYFPNWREHDDGKDDHEQPQWRMTASVRDWNSSTWMTPVENHVQDVLSQSMSSVNSVATRDREDSIATTLVGSPTDSEAGTPLACSPVPPEDELSPLAPSSPEKHHSSTANSSLDRRSIGVQGPDMPLFSKLERSPISPDHQKSSLQLVFNEEGKVDVVQPPPVPAKRTILKKIESRNEVKMRKDFMDMSSQKLLANISRLSKSTAHLASFETNSDRFSQSSVPAIRTSLWSCADEMDTDPENDPLAEWKRRAECRARSNAPSVEAAKPIDRVVASMIKSIEDSRLTALDRPANLNLEPKPPTDAGTQTSPFSLSRSSSFDWVHDATEGALRDLKTPMSTPRSEQPPSVPRIESSSETDDADREVAEMTRRVEETTKIVRSSTQSRESGTAAATKDKLFPDLEESIAMLLQYGKEAAADKVSSPHKLQHTPVPVAPPRSIAPKAKLRTVPLQVSSTPPEIRRPVPQYPLSMSESVYDNMGANQKKRNDSPPSHKPTASQTIIEDLLEGKVPLASSGNGFPRKISSLGSHNRAGSCEILNDTPKSRLGASSASLKEAEEEALECCQWLRKAGFPQYAKQYEEGQFPIDLRSVRSDHEFLEADSLRALFRRIDALNRCVIMRDDNVVLRRRNEDYNYDMYSFNDDEDQVALSGNWKYQRNSHTWSRIGNEQMYGAPVGRVVSTVANYGFRDPYAVKDTRHSPYEERIPQRAETRGLERYDLRPDDATNSKLQRSQSERIKDTAKALLKKVNPRSGSRRRRESRTRDASTMEISDPRLVSYNTASPESARMLLTARPTTLSQETRPRQSRSKSARRQGVVLLSPSSPESSSTDDSFRLRFRERSVPPPRMMDRGFCPPEQLQPLPPPAFTYLRRERTPMDDFLYGVGHNSLTRPRNRVAPRYYDNVYYGTVNSGNSSPAYSSPYSNRSIPTAGASATVSYPTPPIRSRQLNIHPDGYYMHGHQFDVSPDTSLNRNSRAHLQFSSASPSTSNGVVPQLHVDTVRAKLQSQSSLDNTDEEQCSTAASQNRRDSGVGSSLSRSPSGPSTQRIRQSVLPYSLSLSVTSSSNSSSNGSWKGTTRRNGTTDRLMSSSLTACTASDEMFFHDEELLKTMDSLSAVEMARMRALAYLSVTAVMEKYMGSGAIKLDPIASNGSGHSTGKNWTKNLNLNMLIKKVKNEGKAAKEAEENTVFGQPLDVIYKRTGHCLPRTILEVLRYLRQMAPDTVGMFRKNGVKSRILELRQHCDRDADSDVFVDATRLDPGQVHDAADMLKQYLRDLPDRLMTSRLSEVFASIFLHVPENERINALRYALLLLPDENREALQTLLFFLGDIAKFSEGNSMTATNLSVCFTPSLFHLSASRLDKMSSSRRHKTVGAAGMPTEKEMLETRAAQQCLTYMIVNCRNIFQSPEVAPAKNGADYEEDLPILKELSSTGPRPYLMEKLADMLKDNADRWKSWIVEGNYEGVEISARKSADSHPLRPFRVWVDVAAPPKEVLHRIMKERCVWDASVLNWRSIDMQLAPDTDLHQFVLNDTVGHPTRDCYVVRYHKMDIPELRGACAVVERSVQCGETQLLGGVTAVVLDSRFLIEPKSGYSRVTHISKVDLRGRSSTWYNRVYGSLLARQMSRLRDSFKKADDFGPETKV